MPAKGCYLAQLTDYLNPESLQQLQDAFTTVAQMPIRICDASGAPLTIVSVPIGATDDDAASDKPVRGMEIDQAGSPIMVDNHVIGRIKLESPEGERLQKSVYPRHLRLIGLVTGVVARLCQRERQLRTRVEELATRYRLTGEFTGQRDLQSLLDLVGSTVVDIMHAKACSIRMLSEDGSEMLLKAGAGLSPEYLDKGPVRLSDSKIDAEALSTGEAIYIENVETDPRFLYPVEAAAEGIVSGLCAPMMYKGKGEGAIRVYMGHPHTFGWFEMSMLKSIAAEAAAAIVNARLHEEAIHSANMQRALRLAGEVQRRMIPSEPPAVNGLDIAAIYVPCFELGGDFYDFLDLPEDNLGLVVCDVVGKGVRASLLTASIRASLRAHASNVYEMSQVLQNVNRDLCADTYTSDFATLFYCVINTATRTLTYSNAGHMPPLLVRDGQAIPLDVGGPVLGIDTSLTWPKDVVQLQEGDYIFAYTDGLHEAMNFDDDPFGQVRVRDAVLAACADSCDAKGLAKHVLWEMRRFAGLQKRPDDLTLVAVKVL